MLRDVIGRIARTTSTPVVIPANARDGDRWGGLLAKRFGRRQLDREFGEVTQSEATVRVVAAYSRTQTALGMHRILPCGRRSPTCRARRRRPQWFH